MKKVASERRHFGYRRIHVILDRQGMVMNLKKLRRLNREEKLTVALAWWLKAGVGHETSSGFAVASGRALEPGLR
jgi:putative transposase